MTLEQFEELTGITVKANQIDLVTAQINRCRRILETLLGWSLDPDKARLNLYNELGKSADECACPNVDPELPPDDDDDPSAAEGRAYRLYPYNAKDRYFHVDPFTTLNVVKLVKDGITIKTFDEHDIRVSVGRNGWAKFIENCQRRLCVCSCTNCVQLAVDAEWLPQPCDSSVGECVPDDLLYLWADMVNYYANCKVDVKSETIGGHSYSKFDRLIPEQQAVNLKLIKQYAGPFGAVTRKLTV